MFFQPTQVRSAAVWSGATAVTPDLGPVLLHAFNPQPGSPHTFEIFGIASQDLIRLHVTNVASKVGAPSDPCSGRIGFFSGDGTVLKAATPGTSAALQASAQPVVNFVSPDSCSTAVSAEVADAATGRTYALPQLTPSAPYRRFDQWARSHGVRP